MSRLPLSPFWTNSRQIPIYLDTGNEREQICPTCDLSSKDHPIHCIATASPAPPSYRSAASPATSSGGLAVPPAYDAASWPAQSSRNLAVPTLRIETPRRWYRPQPPRPALRFDVQSTETARPRARTRHVTFSPLSPVTTIQDDDAGRKSYASGLSVSNTPVDDHEYSSKSKMGLGIPEAPFHPDFSPVRSPGSEAMAKAEKGEPSKVSTPNLAEGIEQKLWKYSASGNPMKSWLLEIVSWLVSALCISTIIVMLYFLQDKPFPKRWPMNITLNAYIATLSRIASAALILPVSEALGQLKWSWFQGRSKKMWDFELFDNASRGPWGSFMLLIRTKGTTLAALGAVITIFVMAMDPFFQQIVRYPQRTILLSENSTIPRATRYDPHYAKKFQEGNEVIDHDQEMSVKIEDFFLDLGTPEILIGNATQAEIPVSCTTSNCLWEPFQTLGICSECVDVADMLEFDCLTARLDWVQNSTSFVKPQNGTMCGWFFNATSSNPLLMLGYEVDSINRPSGEILTTRVLPLISNIRRVPIFDGSINFKHVRNPLTDFVVVSTEEGPDQDSVLRSVFEHQKPRALECILSWCVKTIESSYHEGTFNENTKEVFLNTTAGAFPWTFAPADAENPDSTDDEIVQYLQDITIDPSGGSKHQNGSTYGVSNQTAYNVIQVFDDFVPAFATLANNVSRTYVRYTTWEQSPYLREFPRNPWSAPNNITRHMERLATVMTNIVRQSSKETVSGKSFTVETYVGVRWVWLSLPLALLVLTFVFLVGTVLRTSIEERDRVGVWKNSAIATLLYGLPDDMQRKITTATQGHGTPRTKAKELNVRMLPTKDWRVSGYTLSPVVMKSKQPPGWI